jgi:hypothetical protein
LNKRFRFLVWALDGIITMVVSGVAKLESHSDWAVYQWSLKRVAGTGL